MWAIKKNGTRGLTFYLTRGFDVDATRKSVNKIRGQGGRKLPCKIRVGESEVRLPSG